MEGSTAPDKSATLERFQASIDRLSEINNKAITSIKNSKDFNKSVYDRLVPINQKIKDILNYITKINARIKELEGQVQQNQQMGQGNAAEIEQLKTEIKQLKADKQQLTQEKTELDATIQQLTTEKEAIQRELDALKTTIEAKGGEDAAKAAAIEEAAKKNQTALDEVNAQLATCKQEVEQLKIEKEQNNKSIKDNTDAVQKLTAENTALKTENDDLIQKIMTATIAISSAQETIDKIFNDGVGTNSDSQKEVNNILTEIERELGLINDAIQGRGTATDGPSQFVETTTKGLRTKTTETQPTMIAQPAPTANQSSILTPEQLKVFNNSLKILNNKIANSDPNDNNKRMLYSKTRTNLQNAINNGDAKTATEILSRPPFLNKGTSVQGGKTKKRRRQRGGFVVGKTKKRERISSIRRGSFNKKRRTITSKRPTSKRPTSKRPTSKRTTSY